jgi:hypothetical protein
MEVYYKEAFYFILFYIFLLKYAVLVHFVTLFKPYCYFLHIISFVFNVKMFVSFILKNAINICTKYIIYLTGSKRVYSRNFNIAPCRDTRYQPIRFVDRKRQNALKLHISIKILLIQLTTSMY